MRNILVVLLVCTFFSGCAGLKAEKKIEITSAVVEKKKIIMDVDLLTAYLKEGDFSGAALRKMAIDKEIIPAEADYEYLRTHRKDKNAVAIWIVVPRQEKIATVESFKKIFKLRGAIVLNSSSHYVDMINTMLYRHINMGQYDTTKQMGIINIFKSIAIFQGDYDDGRNKAIILRQWIGEAAFEDYKKEYPEDYKILIGK